MVTWYVGGEQRPETLPRQVLLLPLLLADCKALETTQQPLTELIAAEHAVTVWYMHMATCSYCKMLHSVVDSAKSRFIDAATFH